MPGMRRVGSVIVVMVGALVSAAPAQVRREIETCRAIADDALRLQCYDGIGLPRAGAPRPKYERVELAELEEFPLSYRGSLVEVTGWLVPSGDFFLLKTDPEAADALPVEAEALTRQQRQAILATCAEGCGAIVQGKVAPVNFSTGIIADIIRADEAPGGLP
jgi:hypothetical protein